MLDKIDGVWYNRGSEERRGEMRTRIEWYNRKEVKIQECTHQEWEAKREWCRKNGKEARSKTGVVDWMGGVKYRIDRWGKSKTRLCVSENGELTAYVTDDSEERNERKLTGRDAYNTVSRMFQDRTGKRLRQAFGGVEKTEWHRLVPPAPQWQNPTGIGVVTDMVCKADVSSCYPYELSKTLPSAKKRDTKTVKGRVAPTEEYPFAFYTKSGHMSIYGEFDTREAQGWDLPRPLTHPVVKKRGIPFYTEVSDEEEVTVLMKKSEYSLAPEMRTLYEGRNEHQEYKLVMNAFIGYFWREFGREKSNLSHLVVVVHNRARMRILSAMKEVTEKGGVPMLAVVDSLAWQRDVYEGCTTTKELGAFVREYTNVQLVMSKTGQYGLYDADRKKFLLVKHQGVEANDAEEKLKRIHTPADFYREFTSTIQLYDRITGETNTINTKGGIIV